LKEITARTIILLLLLTAITPIASPVLIPTVSAQEATIEVSSTTFCTSSSIEVRVIHPGLTVENVTVRIVDYATGQLLDTKKAGRYAAGAYAMYILGSLASTPSNPLIELGSDSDYVWQAGVASTDVEKKYVIEYVYGATVVTKVVSYVYSSPTIELDRSTYPLNATNILNGTMLRVYIVDPDYNTDPTAVDEGSVDVSQLWVKFTLSLANGTTKETPFVTFGSLPIVPTGVTYLKETGVNTGKFGFYLNLTATAGRSILHAIRQLIPGYGSFTFSHGDMVTMTIANGTTVPSKVDPTNATVTFTVVKPAPSITVDTASVSEEVKITLDYAVYNIRSWAKDWIPQKIVNVTLVYGPAETQLDWVKLPPSPIFNETEVNTGLFAATIPLNFTKHTAINTDDTMLTIPLDLAKKGYTFRIKVNTTMAGTTYEARKDVALSVPSLSLDKASYLPTDTVTITITDPDLNDKATVREGYYASVPANTEVKDVKLASTAVVGAYYLNVTIVNATTNTAVTVPTGKTLTLNPVEKDLNSADFVLKLKLSDIGAGEGNQLTFKVKDYTGGGEASATINVGYYVKALTLDRTEYPLFTSTTDVVKVRPTLVAPEGNVSPTSVDTATVTVNVYYANGTLFQSWTTTTLTETGVNTGEFTGDQDIAETPNLLHRITPALVNGRVEVVYGTLKASAPIVAKTATVSVEPTSVTFGSEVKVTIKEPNKDGDSKQKDKLQATVKFTDTTDTLRTLSVDLTETDVKSGVFEATLTVGGRIDTQDFKPKPGTTISVEYTDNTPSYVTPDMEGFPSEKVSASVTMKSHTGILVLDKYSCGPDAQLVINLTDPDLNTDITVSNRANITLSVGTVLKTITLTETGVSTGIFTVTTDKLTTVFNLAAGKLIGKKMSVSYADSVNKEGKPEVVVKYVDVISVDPVIRFDKPYYDIGETAKIVVEDLDANTDPSKVEVLKEVVVRSTTDPVGVSVSLAETGVNTGVFEGYVKVSDTIGGGMIYAKLGDTLTVTYKDSYPADYVITEKPKTFEAKATVGAPPPPIPMEAAKPSMVDPETRETLTTAKVGRRVYLSTTITNKAAVSMDFEALIQVKDEAGVVVYIGTVGGTIAGGQTFNVRVSWTPPAPGKYTVEVVVWKSLAEPEALSEKMTTTITVTE